VSDTKATRDAHGLRCFTISITPFDQDQQVDVDALRGHLRRQGEAGCGVFVAGGASGEAFTLSDEERLLVMRTAVEELKGIVPVRAMGVEPHSATEMIHFAELAAKADVDAVQIYSLDQGHGLRPTDDEIELYYNEVLSSISLPAVISSHHLAGYVIPLPVLQRLLEKYPRLIGINVSTPDINYITRLVDATKDRAELLCGGMQAVPAFLAMGGHGFMSSQANLVPKNSQLVCDYFAAGNLNGMSESLTFILRVMAYDTFGNVRGVKEALNQLGLPGGHLRRPRLDPEENIKQAVGRFIDDLDIRRMEAP
jgi:4-hydroxy-tetrahydrodipicolinate synthase